jgi:Phytanoyl-CoA dioxygenase (PhyH)
MVMAVSSANIRNTATESIEIGNFRELKADLFRDGFLSLNYVTDVDDIRSIREDIIDLLTDRNVEAPKNLGDVDSGGRGAQILEIASPSALRPRLLESRFFQRALQFSRAVLGPSASLGFDHCITKPPFNATATAWHQDCAYKRITRTPRRLHWWFPLQDVNIQNGCMQFVRGSHLGPVQAHAPRSAGAHALQTEMPPGVVPVVCPLEAGGATIHLPKTLHYTGPNNTDTTRYAWILQIGVRGWIPTILR